MWCMVYGVWCMVYVDKLIRIFISIIVLMCHRSKINLKMYFFGRHHIYILSIMLHIVTIELNKICKWFYTKRRSINLFKTNYKMFNKRIFKITIGNHLVELTHCVSWYVYVTGNKQTRHLVKSLGIQLKA